MTQTVLLGDIIDTIIDYRGKTPKKLGGNWSSTGYRALSAKNIENGNIKNEESIRFIDEELYKKWMKEEIRRGDILLTSEAPLGQPFLWDSDEKIVLSQRLFAIRANKNIVDPNFLYAYISSPIFQSELEARATGSTVKGIRQAELVKTKLILPDIHQQKITGEFIRAIDEKIELNRRMNETLEQIGQALFRHYFINNPKAEKWGEGKLGELTDINKESIGKDYPHNQIRYVDISSVSTGSIDKYEIVELSSAPSRAKRIVRDGDIVWATVRPNRRAYSLIMNPADNMIASTGFAVLSPKKNALGFVYYHTSSQSFTDYLTLHARGAAYPAVTASDFKNAPIAIPDVNTLEEFNKLALPSMQMMSELKEQIQTLTTLRDTLLPQLISGKVKIGK